jgi:hypothetical protein
MEGLQRIAESLGLSPSKIDFAQATRVANGWLRIPLQNMPDIEGVGVYCLTEWDRPKKIHGCRIMWALLHIWRGRPVPGTSSARQAGHNDVARWYHAEDNYAEWFAVPVQLMLDSVAQTPVQAKLEISTTQCIILKGKPYTTTKDMHLVRFDALHVREIAMTMTADLCRVEFGLVHPFACSVIN